MNRLTLTVRRMSSLGLKEEGYDRYVVWTVLALMGIGVVAVYSAISFMAHTKSGGDTELFLVRHVIRIGLALLAILVFSRLNYRKLSRLAKPTLLAVLILLVAVQMYGVVAGGAARWLQVGMISFQPSELARVALVVHVGAMLAAKQSYIKSFDRAFVPIMIWTVPTVLLIGKSDLSSATMLLVTVLVMCYVGRMSLLHLGGLSVALFAAAVLFLMISPERAARLEAHFNVKLFPHTQIEEVFDRQGEGYQSHQARIAVASGNLLGVGPGKSTQRDFLPAPYNDFIFAIIAEEYGLLGAAGLLVLFFILVFRGFIRIARDAVDDLGLFLATGATAMLAIYAFVHAAVTTGLLPVTGLPMPFVSYGGTSLLANGVLIGILLNVSRHHRG